MKRVRWLMVLLAVSGLALANAEINPEGIPPLSLEPDPVNPPALEPGAASPSMPDSNEAKLDELEANSDALSPEIAEENAQLEALPK